MFAGLLLFKWIRINNEVIKTALLEILVDCQHVGWLLDLLHSFDVSRHVLVEALNFQNLRRMLIELKILCLLPDLNEFNFLLVLLEPLRLFVEDVLAQVLSKDLCPEFTLDLIVVKFTLHVLQLHLFLFLWAQFLSYLEFLHSHAESLLFLFEFKQILALYHKVFGFRRFKDFLLQPFERIGRRNRTPGAVTLVF